MPKDISSSSSEDEANSPAAESAAKQKETEEKTTRYRCPADYVSFSHVPCSSTLTSKLKKKDNELWLIKAPVSFNPECFRNIKVPLSGLHTLKVPSAAGGAATGGVQQIYSILASSGCTSDMRLLTSDKQSDKAVFAPTFSGMLNVCESYGGAGAADRPPQIIPAAPAPSIPPGLRQRFHPFGSKAPARAAESETDGAALEPSSAAKRFIEDAGHDDEEEEEGRKKKKKKKKEKRIKMEDTEQTVEVKEEPVAGGEEEMEVERSFQEDDHSEEKRKKKKKKKDKEREREVEEGPGPGVKVKVEEITVKPEPIDTSYSDAAEDSGKKKKKKKKSKTGDN